jgi:DNA mismatch repair protein MutS2
MRKISALTVHTSKYESVFLSGLGRSQLLIDEFGAGTEPQICGAIAEAIRRNLNQHRDIGVITTHIPPRIICLGN